MSERLDQMRSALKVRQAAEMLGVDKDLLYREYNKETSTIDVGWTQLRVLTIGHRVIVPRREVERALCEPESAEQSNPVGPTDNGWMLTLDARGTESAPDDAAIDIFAELLKSYGGAVAGSNFSWSATITVSEFDAEDAIAKGIRVIRAAATAAGLPDWPMVRIEIKTYDEFDREIEAHPNQ